ncbi:hypothetical protein CTL2C_256 [Chlamydia trachomatis L2c]|nr:hypothetical protein CTL2C_256 [Chlamydia trachomatis L2c]
MSKEEKKPSNCLSFSNKRVIIASFLTIHRFTQFFYAHSFVS